MRRHHVMEGVTKHKRDGRLVLEVDTDKVIFKNLHWKELGSFGKRKFENLLIIENGAEGYPAILYN